MKKLMILLVMGFGILLLPSCMEDSENKNLTETTNTYTAITILMDNTETVTDNSRMNMVPNKSIIDMIGSGNGTVKFQPVNRVSINNSATASIQYGEGATGHTIVEAQNDFKANLDTIKQKFLGPTEKTKSSSIWKTVIDNLKELSESKADKKVLIIMSDMIEFSGNGDFYHTTVKDIKKIKQRMQDSCGIMALPEKSGVRVIVIYNPGGDILREAQFLNAYAIWEMFFEESGIPYERVTNLSEASLSQ